ncbi:single-stranded DNA-binding protein WHY1, chloroplastic [Rhododendron vialii]|uniref:single-stranded DNA-binding protein WHY1, chloroplastic n=1 Tax=Rhododendron vialii TaxID=182163 RepID=UPI00265F3F2D|nr:single-stranded DNA-binding protein WHY1, chloroplastic [Rhododendron vialii]
MPNLVLSSPGLTLQNPSPFSVIYSLYSPKSPKPRTSSLKCSLSDNYGQQQQRFSPNNSFPYPPQSGVPPKVFVGHSIYKGKAVLNLEPRGPEFISLESGAFRIGKEGSVFLQFAPASSTRSYDWDKKQVFSLSVTEIGTLISLGAEDVCEFFHDPLIGKSDEGKVRKVLKVEPLSDGSGHLFYLSVLNKLIDMEESIFIPVSRGEYAVLVSVFNFILPYLVGWNTFADSVRPQDTRRMNNASPRSGVDYEWSR